jgi:hypothetical protein
MGAYFSRERGLSQSTVERALLVLGLLPPSMGRLLALPASAGLGAVLVDRSKRRGGLPWLWRLRPSTERLARAPEAARRLAAAGEILISETRETAQAGGPGLRLEATLRDRLDGVELITALRAGGADSVYLRLRDEGEVTWDWPLRIAVRPDSDLLGGISAGSSLRHLFRAHRLDSPMRFNLVLLEESLARAAGRLASGARLTTDAIVIFGGLGAQAGLAPYLVTQLRAATGAQGVFVLDSPDSGLASGLVEKLIRELSHGLPLDAAAGRLADEAGPAVWSWSTRGLALAASVREQGRLLAKRMQQMRGSQVPISPAVRDAMTEADIVRASKTIYVGNLPFSVSDDDIRDLFDDYGTVESVNLITDRESGRPRGFGFVEMSDGADEAIQALHQKEIDGRTLSVTEARPRVARPPHSQRKRESYGTEPDGARTWERAEELGVKLERRLPYRGTRRGMPAHSETSTLREMSFEAESSGATAIADLAEAVDATMRAGVLPERFLQVRLETPSGRAVDGERPLRPARDYRACVFIGARRRQWLGLAEPVDEPPPRPDGRPLTLQVMFWEPGVCPEPRVVPLKLYPTGDTGVVAFPFQTAGAGRFTARIAVYHRNRNLQTGLLQGVVGDVPSALSFELDAAPNPHFTGLEARGVIGASIVVNDDPSGRMRAFTYRDGVAAVADLSDPGPVGFHPGRSLDKLTQALGRCITRITQSPEDYDDLSKEGSRELLRDLAQHGATLLRHLHKHTNLGDRFDEVSHVQIVRAHVDAFFPAEFLYAGEPPEEDATVCRGAAVAAQALRDGRCCDAYDDDPKHTVCPLRFWSLSKVIERHAHRPEHAQLTTPFQLSKLPANQRQWVLDPLASAVLAASDRVDLAVPGTVAKLRAKLDSLVRKPPVASAVDWDAWVAEIERSDPHLLVLLPHHEHKGGFDVLEIGAGQTRRSTLICEEHVRARVETSPIVLLIGCETGSAKVDLESLVPAFKDEGAAIVVSTVASILGRQAGPATEVLVEEMQRIQGDEDATFGQAMLAARRRLLAEGAPMVLGLTSYGDADWRIAAGS